MKPDELLAQTTHRPYPLADGPWVMAQTWYDLLFAHWPLEPANLRPHLPAQLTLDTYEGQAWVGVVPFGMTRVYPRRLWPAPWLSHFLELNVRTYVTDGKRPGVYFFSLDAANPVAVEIARRWYQLPYFSARMSARRAGGWTHYRSYRIHRGAPPAEFEARYRPSGPVSLAKPGSLEAWLTERYCLYLVTRAGKVFRGEIHHPRWPLQPAEATISANSMAASHGLVLPSTEPKLHYAKRLDTIEWPIRQVTLATVRSS